MDETTKALLKKNNVSMGKKITPAKYDNNTSYWVKEDPILKRIRKKEKKSRRYNAVCLGFICLFLFCLGIPITVLGDIHDIQDLLILGPFFTIAGVLFILAMVVILIKAKINANRRIKPKKKRTKILKNMDIPEGHILPLKAPSEAVLYGGDIIHVPDMGSVPETCLPSPPPVYIPNDVMDMKNPTINLPMEEAKAVDVSYDEGKHLPDVGSATEASLGTPPSSQAVMQIDNPTITLSKEVTTTSETSYDDKPVIGFV